MEHLYLKKDAQSPVWLLLHGTGGDEHSLVALAQSLLPEASILSLRGDVQESGMNRFFKRFGEGDFDLESLSEETQKLAQTIQELVTNYQIEESQLIGLGYSNGANILGHYLLTQPSKMTKAVLFHNMLLTKDVASQDLSDKKVWMSFGEKDPIVPKESFMAVKELFTQRKATVQTFETPFSHGIEQSELQSVHNWLQQ